MHQNSFFPVSSGRVKGIAAVGGEPLKLAQLVIIGWVNDSEFSKGKRYHPDGVRIKLEICSRIEMPAGIIKADPSPFTFKPRFLPAHQHGPINPDHPGRKTAVVTTIRNCRLQIVDCRFFPSCTSPMFFGAGVVRPFL